MVIRKLGQITNDLVLLEECDRYYVFFLRYFKFCPVWANWLFCVLAHCHCPTFALAIKRDWHLRYILIDKQAKKSLDGIYTIDDSRN